MERSSGALPAILPAAYFRQALGDPLRLHTWIGLPAEARDSVACAQHVRSLLRCDRLSRGSHFRRVRDLADDLDDVAVRVEDPQLPVGAVAVVTSNYIRYEFESKL